ncbi:uncharacterized protein BCR38DRAFT_436828 [Pseudomassariella vexata]|uniref:Uncharacterized protein n=1 Tax=Pseudomassariella vexata TaxID=1141098 RepID=A0A1Y2DVZ3_9PEZI|nr:uncharacterized protein BCR38DRAFT_436828 [Pseudomassariella vexata]ORY63433.1 hypothetical protein BCR38DRAFT_436828 [Pseudomassariella vexata]
MFLPSHIGPVEPTTAPMSHHPLCRPVQPLPSSGLVSGPNSGPSALLCNGSTQQAPPPVIPSVSNSGSTPASDSVFNGATRFQSEKHTSITGYNNHSKV